MSEKNGREKCVCIQKNSTTNNRYSVSPTPTKNAEIKGDLHGCKYSKKAHSRYQTCDNIENASGTETLCRCRPRSYSQKEPRLETTGLELQPAQIQHHKPEWFDCFMQGCRKQSCFNGLGVLPIEYPSPGKPCIPEHVRPHLRSDKNRRPPLPEPPEMLSTLKQGIRHPFQITQRRKEMQTQLDKLTTEHEAFAFSPGTRTFFDDAYYLKNPASNLVENYDLVRRDIHMQEFLECNIRPSLLAFNREKYKFFRERLPMPEKRIVNIPGNRTTHWHNWIIRPLRTTYTESWRKDIRVPDNWFGPAPPQIC